MSPATFRPLARGDFISCGKVNTPKRYRVSKSDNNSHSPTNNSRLSTPQSPIRSALDKNLSARANSKNPKTTFNCVIQPPDLGRRSKLLGNRANKTNGKASATPNPSIPIESCIAPWVLVNEPAKSDPNIGPVQENETTAKVKAIKKTPTTPCH